MALLLLPPPITGLDASGRWKVFSSPLGRNLDSPDEVVEVEEDVLDFTVLTWFRSGQSMVMANRMDAIPKVKAHMS